MDASEASAVCETVLDAIGEAVVADRRVLETVLTGVLARGHVLLEDVPGTGKTLTARSFATALGLSFARVQFTPLADEINRAPPKTQAALLEAMSEKQVSADGTTYRLPEPFFVIATQNPIEEEGTFALPEAQRDRFVLKTSLGYPDRAGARRLVDRRADRATRAPEPRSVLDGDRVAALQTAVESVAVDDAVRDYVVDLGRHTREDDRVEVGVSPRGIQRLFETVRARALVEGRAYVVPDDVKAVARETLAHRLVLTAEATVRDVSPTAVVEATLDRVDVPAVAAADD
ncbi:ATPase [Halobacteriales archaeon QS_8_69_73]|nr:MAG: ATPase [Halobacteriales archaeon QS_8_69_73]